MANTEIDSLSLDIKITGLNNEDLKNIDKLSRAVARLSKALKESDFSKLEQIKVPKGLKNIQIVTQNIKNVMGGGTNGDNATSTNDEMERATELLEDYSRGAEDVAVEIEDDSLIIQDATERIKVSTRQARKALKELLKDIDNASGKSKKQLNALQRFIKRFKTIAFIKAIRAILNAMVQAIQEGVKNLAVFDKAFNETMSKIVTAITNIKNSLSLIFRPIIESLEPFIVSISNAFVTLGNAISKLQASMKGLSTYTKINAKYMEDYANASKKASLFSFDTFNTLDLQDSDKYETAEIDSEETSKIVELMLQTQTIIAKVFKLIGSITKEIGKLFNFLSPFLIEIQNIIEDIIDTVQPFIDDLLEALNPLFEVILHDLLPPLLEIVRDVAQPILQIVKSLTPLITLIISKIVEILAPIIKAIASSVKALEPIISVISTIVSFIVDNLSTILLEALNSILTLLQPVVDVVKWLLDAFSTFNQAIHDLFSADFEGFANNLVLFFKKVFWGLLKVLAGMIDATINAIINAINVIFVPLNKLSEWFDWGWEIGITWRSNLADLVPSYANGGIVGELWQMNEYGNPEMLYNANNSGNTAVITQQQLSMAFEQAIYNTGLLDTIAKAGVIQLDGRAIAQSTTFKNEINRTNPSLNIR